MLRKISIIDKILFFEDIGYVSVGCIFINDIMFDLKFFVYGIDFGSISLYNENGDKIITIFENQIHKFRYSYDDFDYEIIFKEA